MTFVKVTEAGETAPSLVSEEVTEIVTSSLGSESRTIVKVACVPVSLVFPLIALTDTPLVSSSVFVTDTSFGFWPLYAGSADVAGAVTIEKRMSPSSRLSATPVTVTVSATFQSPSVKVTEAGETVPSLRSSDVRPMVTSAVGCDVSTIVKVAVVPASDVRPLIVLTVKPTVSLSVFVTETSFGSSPLYWPSVDVAAAVAIV